MLMDIINFSGKDPNEVEDYWSGALGIYEREEFSKSSMETTNKYIEAEFKIFHSALKTAWNKWVNYKESVK